MERIDFSTPTQAEMMYCPACRAWVHVGVAGQHFVYYCLVCRLQYDYADCRQISVTLPSNPPKKGESNHEEKPRASKTP